jgi:hypothetical protein
MSIFLTSKKSYSLYFFVVVLFYWDTRDAGFVTDFLGWQYSFDKCTFWEIIHASDRGIKSLYHLTHLEMYTISALFGTWGLPWFLLFSTLFALNAWLIAHFLIKFTKNLKIERVEWPIFFGVLCFLFSPYQAEVMVWRASFHYLTGFAMLLSFLVLTQKYLDSSQKKYAIIANILFLLSTLTLEFFFLTPFLALVLLIFYHFHTSKITDFRQTILLFVGLPLGSLGLYFIVFHAIYGRWIAHYGAAAHDTFYTPEAVATYGKYVMKHVSCLRYFYLVLPEKYAGFKEKIFNSLDISTVSWTIYTLIVSGFLLGLSRFKVLKPKAKFIYFNFIYFSTLILPVVTLFFAMGLLSENDRLGFMASPFLFIGFFTVLSYLPKRVFITISVLYLMFNAFFLVKTTQLWFKSEKMYSKLVQDFEWWDADEVLILNLPDNFHGVPMFRMLKSNTAFAESLEAFRRRKVTTKMYDVQRYNLVNDSDGVRVRVDSVNHLTVVFNQFGNWWHKEAVYETECYSTKDIVGGCEVTLKPTDKKRVILFQTGSEWHVVDLSKIGIEQR